MGGVALQETGLDAHPRHWLRGGFPLSFLAEDAERVEAVPLSEVAAGLDGLFPT